MSKDEALIKLMKNSKFLISKVLYICMHASVFWFKGYILYASSILSSKLLKNTI